MGPVTSMAAPDVGSSRQRSSEAARTYQVRTYGCQMNVHDSERLAGLLEAAGYRRAADGADADVVVFNTCAVRENADNKLYGNLSHLVPRKQADPNMQIAVGGCLAQKDRDAVLRQAPWVDVVFGTHNIGSLPTLLDRARHNKAAQVEIVEALKEFPSDLPAARESAYAGWVSISVGCNNTCTFCIVPALRGKEVDRQARRRVGRGAGARGPGRPRGDAARAERQRLRRLVRRPRSAARPRGVRATAARMRADRRPRAGPVHLASPRRVHRRRHRGDGGDTECVPGPSHADAVGFGPGAAGHAPLVPLRALPVDPREGARRHPARRHHHRPDRRLPR